MDQAQRTGAVVGPVLNTVFRCMDQAQRTGAVVGPVLNTVFRCMDQAQRTGAVVGPVLNTVFRCMDQAQRTGAVVGPVLNTVFMWKHKYYRCIAQILYLFWSEFTDALFRSFIGGSFRSEGILFRPYSQSVSFRCLPVVIQPVQAFCSNLTESTHKGVN